MSLLHVVKIQKTDQVKEGYFCFLIKFDIDNLSDTFDLSLFQQNIKLNFTMSSHLKYSQVYILSDNTFFDRFDI